MKFFQKVLQFFFINRFALGKFLYALHHEVTEFAIRKFGPAHSQYGKILRKKTKLMQIEQRRNQFSSAQIPRCAKNDKYAVTRFFHVISF